jgi:peroxiredoxin
VLILKEEIEFDMRNVAIIGALLAVGTGLFAKPPVPRPAQDLKIMEPSGHPVSLTGYPGKVLLVQFLYTTCPHCMATAKVFTSLQKELGPQGLQVIGVAFNEEAEGDINLVQAFVDSNGIGFPIGLANRDAVLSYLGISVMSRFTVPQIMVIDRNGVIRAQSEILGSEELQDEARLRPLLESLLKESKQKRR